MDKINLEMKINNTIKHSSQPIINILLIGYEGSGKSNLVNEIV